MGRRTVASRFAEAALPLPFGLSLIAVARLSPDFLFIFPHALRWLRSIEPLVSLGAQYQVLCQR